LQRTAPETVFLKRPQHRRQIVWQTDAIEERPHTGAVLRDYGSDGGDLSRNGRLGRLDACRRRRRRSRRDELRGSLRLAETREGRAHGSRRIGQLLRGRARFDGIVRGKAPGAAVDPPAVADDDPGRWSDARQKAERRAEVDVAEVHADAVERQRARYAVGQREHVREWKRVRRVGVRQTANRRETGAEPRSEAGLAARKVRMLFECARDRGCGFDDGRTVAERGDDVRLKAVSLELRRDAPDQIAKRLLAIGLELHLDSHLHWPTRLCGVYA